MSDNVLAVVNKMGSSFKQALPAHFNSDRFTRIALTALRKNPKLMQCNQASLLGSLMMFAQLGLEPNTPLGHAYLVPYGKDVTPIIGYKGLLDLAYRTGSYETIDAHPVYDCDEFEFEYGFNEKLIHKPGIKEPGSKPTYYYAFYKLKNGGRRFRVWTHQDCLDHGKKYSKSFNNGPWKTDTKAMCLKTVLKDLLSYAPLSSEEKKIWNVAQMEQGIVRIAENNMDIDVEFEDPKLIESTNEAESKEASEKESELKDLGI